MKRERAGKNKLYQVSHDAMMQNATCKMVKVKGFPYRGTIASYQRQHFGAFRVDTVHKIWALIDYKIITKLNKKKYIQLGVESMLD